MINVNTTVSGRITPDDGKLLDLAQHFDEFIVDWELENPSVIRDRIPRGTFDLFNGYSQVTNVFRGVLGPQSGLSDWTKITPTAKPAGSSTGNDICQYNPRTYDWAMDSIETYGYRTSWVSPVFCVNDLKYTSYAMEQLSMIIQAGSQVSAAVKEVFNTEMYMKVASDAGRMILLVGGGGNVAGDTSIRVTYDPFTVNSNNKTYITFNSNLLPRLSTLNEDILVALSTYLSRKAPGAAMSKQGGAPIFGLIVDMFDFESAIKNDEDLREDLRYARPEALINGFNLGFKTIRGFALIHSDIAPRFKLVSVSATTATAERVDPKIAERPGTIGLVPDINPDYLTAELGTAIVFMNEVISILVPPVLNKLVEGMVFGPAPDFNGTWAWINNASDSNPLREIGYFFSRYEYYVKPLRYADSAYVVIYRRCPHVIQTTCKIDSASITSVGPLHPVSNLLESEFDATNRTVTLTLTSLLRAGVGDTVSIKKDDGNSFTATLLQDSNAPTYVFGWAAGATYAPTAYTEMNDASIVTVTVG